MSGGRSPKNKGYRGERELVDLLQEQGIAAERVPMSGAIPGHPGDVTFPVQGQDWVGEVKRRANGLSTIYRWLAGRRIVFARTDHNEWIVMIRLKDFAPLAREARPRSAHEVLHG